MIFSRTLLVNAMIWSVVVGYMFLPEAFGIDLPGLPPLEKNTVIIGSLLLGVIIYYKGDSGQVQSALVVANSNQKFGYVMIALIGVMFLAPLLTIALNRSPVFVSGRALQGLGVRDFISTTFNSLTLVVPFLLARRYLATPVAHRILLQILLVGGLIYTVFALIEIRLSPQLHNWVYGFHQHSFAQHVRGGDFRPKIFLRHGLWVGFFFFSVILAAGALARAHKGADRTKYLIGCAWLLVIMVLSKNVAATILALTFTPLLFLGRSLQVKIVSVIAILFLFYPAVRQSNVVDVTAVTEFAAQYSPERAQSFQFRLDNEDALLARALEKPVFGWGGWGRSRIYDEFGEEVSVTDGLWIIIIGAQGWVGYIVFFGLLIAPVLVLGFTRKRKEIPIETMALALVMAGNFIYMVPNSTLSPIGWLFAGALAGFVQFDVLETSKVPPKDNSRRPLGYTRFAHAHKARAA